MSIEGREFKSTTKSDSAALDRVKALEGQVTAEVEPDQDSAQLLALIGASEDIKALTEEPDASTAYLILEAAANAENEVEKAAA